MAEAPAAGDLYSLLASVFGFSSFRPGQERIVRALLDGRDVFALMPTGGGKSLCYQLPALLVDGVAVVVSPLIALMKDQVDGLRELGVPATYINSSLTGNEIQERQRALLAGQVKLVYVAPERLMMPAFLRLLSAARISFFAIDEAHCISEWGHDFRPEYRELRRLRELFPSVPFAAFTATATTRVQGDITQQLALRDPVRFQGSFNRANLHYEVQPRRRVDDHVVAYLRAHPQASGIIYCASRAGTEDLARHLNLEGIKALPYHAGLDSEVRRRNQDAFIKDDVRVVAATIAFGMGINKPDVRFVIHYDLPKTLENYYQESGRAGRDGDPSDCILFYSGGDAAKLRRFAEEKDTEEERRIARWQVEQMAAWAESTTCRRQALLAYFDEAFAGQADRCCDICDVPGIEEDVTVEAQKLLSCVVRTRERFGLAHVIAVLRGSQSEKVLKFGHDKLSTHGIGRDRIDDFWRHLGRHLLGMGALRQDSDRYNVLSVTESGRAILFGGRRVTMRVPPVKRAETAPADESVANPELFERLRALRKRLADERNLPPYVIFHDRVLREMSSRLPYDSHALQAIPGIGGAKVKSYGEMFLAEIRQYRLETGTAPAETEPLGSARPRGLSRTARDSALLFSRGHDIAKIAQMRNLTPRTVYGHLAEAIEAGEEIDLSRLVLPARRARIEAVLHDEGYDMLAPVRERLGEDFSYGEISLIRAYLIARERGRASA
ncbi:MAG TPA: DNA helicase RecQ [Chloroflexota bacterium]|nr:DNA helicase RecQ [Chloroflexota bacterium]